MIDILELPAGNGLRPRDEDQTPMDRKSRQMQSPTARNSERTSNANAKTWKWQDVTDRPRGDRDLPSRNWCISRPYGETDASRQRIVRECRVSDVLEYIRDKF